MESKNPVKIEKWKVAEFLGISSETLRKMLNECYLDDLVKLGYEPRKKILYRHWLDVVFPSGFGYYDNENNKK